MFEDYEVDTVPKVVLKDSEHTAFYKDVRSILNDESLTEYSGHPYLTLSEADKKNLNTELGKASLKHLEDKLVVQALRDAFGEAVEELYPNISDHEAFTELNDTEKLQKFTSLGERADELYREL